MRNNLIALAGDQVAKAREIASRFPRLRASLDTAAADYGAAPDNTFEFGLRAILDGLQAQLTPPAHQPTSTRPRHPATTKNPGRLPHHVIAAAKTQRPGRRGHHPSGINNRGQLTGAYPSTVEQAGRTT